jgi:hypothetical protein
MNKIFSQAHEERNRKSAAFCCLTLRSQSTVKIPSKQNNMQNLGRFYLFSTKQSR